MDTINTIREKANTVWVWCFTQVAAHPKTTVVVAAAIVLAALLR